MEYDDALKIVITAIGAVGGAGVIIAAFANWLGKLWANKLMTDQKAAHSRELEEFKTDLLAQTERQKVTLKKSEYLFAKQFEAASALIAIHQKVYPRYRYPEMEWPDACEDMARNFEHIIEWLKEFISNHGAALEPQFSDEISLAISSAEQGTLEARGPEVSNEAIDFANEMYNHLKKAMDELHKAVLSQATE